MKDNSAAGRLAARRQRLHEADLVDIAERKAAEATRRYVVAQKLEKLRVENLGFLKPDENLVLEELVKSLWRAS